jgi:hypothetical protein
VPDEPQGDIMWEAAAEAVPAEVWARAVIAPEAVRASEEVVPEGVRVWEVLALVVGHIHIRVRAAVSEEAGDQDRFGGRGAGTEDSGTGAEVA